MTLKTRLRYLERKDSNTRADRVRCVLIHSIAPSPEGPRDLGPFSAHLIGGPTLTRQDGESAGDFLARIDAEPIVSLPDNGRRAGQEGTN